MFAFIQSVDIMKKYSVFFYMAMLIASGISEFFLSYTGRQPTFSTLKNRWRAQEEQRRK